MTNLNLILSSLTISQIPSLKFCMGMEENILGLSTKNHLPRKVKGQLSFLIIQNTKVIGKKERCMVTENSVGMMALPIMANTSTVVSMGKGLSSSFQRNPIKDSGSTESKTAKELYMINRVRYFTEGFGKMEY